MPKTIFTDDANQRIKKDFRNYLMKQCHYKKQTANSYVSAINRLSKYLGLTKSIFDLRNIYLLESIKKGILANNKLENLDSNVRSRFTVGLNRYYEFATHDCRFSNKHSQFAKFNKDIANKREDGTVAFTYKVNECRNHYAYVNNKPVIMGSLSDVYTCFTCPYISID